MRLMSGMDSLMSSSVVFIEPVHPNVVHGRPSFH